MRGMLDFIVATFNPAPDEVAQRAERHADRVVAKSQKLINRVEQSDEFGMMVKGMRGERPKRSGRARKR